MDLATLNKYDPSGMYKIYDRWAELARDSYESKIDVVDFHDIDHIVFAGMGGSGAIGDIFSSILSKTNVHVSVVKGYVLPKTVNSNTLVVTTSISGNTAETLSILESAKKIGCKTIAFSSGGKMQEYCENNRIEYRKIPQLHSPRSSFSIFLYSMLKVLGPLIPVKKEDVVESIYELENLGKKIRSTNLTKENISLNLAEWMTGIPIIYYPFGLQAAAIRFKNSLQENAKTHAMIEDVVEACHNNIMSWEKWSNATPILIEGDDDHIKTKEKWKILKDYFEINKIDYREVFSGKGGILSKLIKLVYLLDYATIYLAIITRSDPSPVRSIDFVKYRSDIQNIELVNV
jgi:glucose/mannose-6-phosphate isomerase